MDDNGPAKRHTDGGACGAREESGRKAGHCLMERH